MWVSARKYTCGIFFSTIFIIARLLKNERQFAKNEKHILGSGTAKPALKAGHTLYFPENHATANCGFLGAAFWYRFMR